MWSYTVDRCDLLVRGSIGSDGHLGKGPLVDRKFMLILLKWVFEGAYSCWG